MEVSKEFNINSNKTFNKLQLVKDFGTTNAKNRLNNLASNIINEENIASADTAKIMLEESAIDKSQYIKSDPKEAEMNRIEDMRKILPPFDLQAASVDKIFNLNDSK